MARIKGRPIRKRVGSNNLISNAPSKVHYNGKSGSVRICISADGGLKADEWIKQEVLENGIILIIPEKIWRQEEKV